MCKAVALTGNLRQDRIDPENHPLFNRLWTTEGFERLTSESVEKFLDTPGLKIALFGDDPNNQKETLDILVIGAELKKAIEAALAPENGAWMSDVKEVQENSRSYSRPVMNRITLDIEYISTHDEINLE